MPVLRLVLVCETATSVVGRNKVLPIRRSSMIACMPVCWTVSTEALQLLLGVALLDSEVIRRAIALKIKKGLPLLDHNWVFTNDLI